MFKIGVFSNPLTWLGVLAMALLQLLFTYAPFMNTAFHSVPIEAKDWLYILATGMAIYFIIEGEKVLRNTLNAKEQ